MPNPSGRGPRRPHKDLQLCAQVADVLTYLLADSEDEVLQDLVVHGVAPTADGGELLVSVQDPHGHGVERVLAALDAARGRLRTEIGDEIHRRRVPRLSFTIVPSVEEA